MGGANSVGQETLLAIGQGKIVASSCLFKFYTNCIGKHLMPTK